LTVFFAILKSLGIKAALKQVVKIDPRILKDVTVVLGSNKALSSGAFGIVYYSEKKLYFL